MNNHNLPIKRNFTNRLNIFRERLLSIAPEGFLMTLLFLLVGFALATGYLMGSMLSEKQEETIALMQTVPEIIERIGEIRPAEAHAAAENAIMTKMKNHETPPVFQQTSGVGMGMPRFALAAGAYIFKQNLQEDRKVAERLGLPFYVRETKKRVQMIRLYVGTFPVQEGMAILRNLKRITSGAFAIRRGRKVAVYGGSFYYPEGAQAWRELLSKQGYNLKEVPAKVTLPLYLAYIGDFDTFEEAEAVGRLRGLSEKEMSVVAIQ